MYALMMAVDPEPEQQDLTWGHWNLHPKFCSSTPCPKGSVTSWTVNDSWGPHIWTHEPVGDIHSQAVKPVILYFTTHNEMGCSVTAHSMAASVPGMPHPQASGLLFITKRGPACVSTSSSQQTLFCQSNISPQSLSSRVNLLDLHSWWFHLWRPWGRWLWLL